MKILIALLFSLVCVLGLHFSGVVDFGLSSPDEEVISFSPKMAPEVTFQKLDGSTFSLKSLRGKTVLINFWASWCGPCFDEFPSMLQLVESFDRKVVLIAVSNDADKKEVENFIRNFPKEVQKQFRNPNVYIAWDEGLKISQKEFGVLRFPETIIIDSDGKMVRKIVGPTNWFDPTMQAYFQSLLF